MIHDIQMEEKMLQKQRRTNYRTVDDSAIRI